MRMFINFIFLTVCTAALAQPDPQALFDQASEQYAAGEYQAAIANYEEILHGDKASAEVYFNLGNAYYKLDSLAPSIYFYNKALQLAPKDSDVLNNLQFAKERTVDLIEQAPKTGWAAWFSTLREAFSYNGWAILAVVCSFLMLIFGTGYYFVGSPLKKRLFFFLGVLAILVSAGSVVLAYDQYNEQQNKQLAIVYAKQIDVHAEPNHNAAVIFTLHEGTQVRVIDHFNGYYRVKLEDDKRGWMKEEALKLL